MCLKLFILHGLLRNWLEFLHELHQCYLMLLSQHSSDRRTTIQPTFFFKWRKKKKPRLFSYAFYSPSLDYSCFYAFLCLQSHCSWSFGNSDRPEWNMSGTWWTLKRNSNSFSWDRSLKQCVNTGRWMRWLRWVSALTASISHLPALGHHTNNSGCFNLLLKYFPTEKSYKLLSLFLVHISNLYKKSR